MSAKKDAPQKHAKHGKPAPKDQDARPDRTAEQSSAVDTKHNDHQQYHAGGAAHDPHHRMQERVDRGEPDTVDVDQETRAENATYNKTNGHHQ